MKWKWERYLTFTSLVITIGVSRQQGIGEKLWSYTILEKCFLYDYGEAFIRNEFCLWSWNKVDLVLFTWLKWFYLLGDFQACSPFYFILTMPTYIGYSISITTYIFGHLSTTSFELHRLFLTLTIESMSMDSWPVLACADYPASLLFWDSTVSCCLVQTGKFSPHVHFFNTPSGRGCVLTLLEQSGLQQKCPF